MLRGKVYVINSPDLAQAAFCSQSLSFAPFVTEFVDRIDELSPSAKAAYSERGLHSGLMKIFAATMAGDSAKSMSAVALGEFCRLLPGSDTVTGIDVPDLWIWIRDIMTISTTSILLGTKHNPWIKDPSLIETYW
jgi:hypothetical protein